MGMCNYCNEINTSYKNRDETKFQCCSCSNKQYSRDLRNGKRVEIKFHHDDYTQGTYEEIIAVLAKNKLNEHT